MSSPQGSQRPFLTPDLSSISGSCFADKHSVAEGSTISGEQSSESERPSLPWKTMGYRAFTNFIAAEPNFFMVRKFGALNVRVALALQDELVRHESRLQRLDVMNSAILSDDDTHNGSFRHDKDDERNELVTKKLPDLLTRYNSHINSYSLLCKRRCIASDDRQEVQKWIDGYAGAIEGEEAAYIQYGDDLIAVQEKEQSLFRKLLEWTFFPRLRFFQRDPFNDEEAGNKCMKEESNGVKYQNHRRLEIFAKVVILVIGLGMLIGPLWVLNVVHGARDQLGVISGFIVLFFALVAIGTDVKVYEALAGAAAYSAVLVVFLQFGSK